MPAMSTGHPGKARKADPADDALLHAAAEGSRADRGRLILRYHRRLMDLIRADLDPVLRPQVEPEDIIQEVYARAFRSFDTFEGDSADSFCSWIQAIARNCVREAHRRHLAARRGAGLQLRSAAEPFSHTVTSLQAALAAHMTTVGGKLVRSEACERLAAALSLLPDHYRAVIEARYIHGKSVEQTMAEIGRSRGSVLMITHRAMRHMADTIREFPLLTRG